MDPGVDDGSSFQVMDLSTGECVPLLALDWQTTSSGATVHAGSDSHGNIQLVPDRAGPHNASRSVDLRRPLDRLPAAVSALALRANGTILAGCQDGSVRRLSAGTMQGLPSHGSVRLASVKFLGDGLRAVTLSADMHRTWRIDGWTLESETIFTAGGGDPISSPDGAHFLGIRGPSLTLRSALDGSVLQEIVLRGAPTNYEASTALMNGGRHVVGLNGKSVCRWVLATGEQDAQLDVVDLHGDTFGNVLAVAEPAGRRVLLHSQYADGVILWDPEDGEPRVLPGILDAQRVVFADATRALVVARRPSDSDSTCWMDRITVISLADGRILGEFTSHAAEITAIAVTGDRVVSADAARQIAFWRLPAP